MYRTFEASANWMVVFAVASLVLSAAAALRWRRDKLVFGVFAVALVAPLLARAWFGWDRPERLCVLFLGSSAAGMVAYSLLRWKGLGFSPVSALGAGAANAILSPLSIMVFHIAAVGERGLWGFALVPASLVIGLLIAAVACTVRAAYRGTAITTGPKAGPRPAGDQERQAVLRMVADGKVSADEASALLAALGEPNTPGDRLPVRVGTLASLFAGVMIATGFVLPWAPVRVAGMHGYQAGHDVGFLGWLILSLGLLPAILACVPALDSHLRQGMLRLLVACTGLTFGLSLAVRIGAAGSAPGVGLIIVLSGFGVQLLSALLDTGLLHRPSQATGD